MSDKSKLKAFACNNQIGEAGLLLKVLNLNTPVTTLVACVFNVDQGQIAQYYLKTNIFPFSQCFPPFPQQVSIIHSLVCKCF